MKLSKDQQAAFDERGYLMLPDLFSAPELAVLRRAAGEVYAMDRKEVVREKDNFKFRTPSLRNVIRSFGPPDHKNPTVAKDRKIS